MPSRYFTNVKEKFDHPTPGDIFSIVYNLRAIVRENRADLTDRGRPIPSIFWLCNTFQQQC